MIGLAHLIRRLREIVDIHLWQVDEPFGHQGPGGGQWWSIGGLRRTLRTHLDTTGDHGGCLDWKLLRKRIENERMSDGIAGVGRKQYTLGFDSLLTRFGCECAD